MSRHGYLPCLIFLGLAASITLACGSNPQNQVQDPQHLIQSLSVSPSSADAQDYPDGRVPFIATGIYGTPPMTVTPLPAYWGTANLDRSPTNAISVNANGIAQCAPGASGVYSIGAWAFVHADISCNTIGPYGQPGCNSVLGTAQLTCP